MNIHVLEQEILNALNIEKEIQTDEIKRGATTETVEASFNSLEKFIIELFEEYRDEWIEKHREG
tara:strand:+ start:788 stop:979 length:192 start_codon:yes stop_codon:yes gene_type:complete